MVLRAAALKMTCPTERVDVPTVAPSATLRLLLTMATVCAPGARELSAISKESMGGMMTRNLTCALTLEGPCVPLCNWESAVTAHGSNQVLEQIKPANAEEHRMIGSPTWTWNT
jgi:hypothetical protein